jgi:hypothetical protein
MLLGWGTFLLPRTRQAAGTSTYCALAIATLNATFAAFTFLYYQWKPVADTVPPWKDPLVLDLSLLFLLAPIAIIAGFVALAKRAPWWLVLLIELSSIPLGLVGLFACISV